MSYSSLIILSACSDNVRMLNSNMIWPRLMVYFAIQNEIKKYQEVQAGGQDVEKGKDNKGK